MKLKLIQILFLTAVLLALMSNDVVMKSTGTTRSTSRSYTPSRSTSNYYSNRVSNFRSTYVVAYGPNGYYYRRSGAGGGTWWIILIAVAVPIIAFIILFFCVCMCKHQWFREKVCKCISCNYCESCQGCCDRKQSSIVYNTNVTSGAQGETQQFKGNQLQLDDQMKTRQLEYTQTGMLVDNSLYINQNNSTLPPQNYPLEMQIPPGQGYQNMIQNPYGNPSPMGYQQMPYNAYPVTQVEYQNTSQLTAHTNQILPINDPNQQNYYHPQ
ncbi:UNKNOWN [Stylonychia lemnae]|uniref:Uncharacterized protein n=1 Tax=Stylonychia lemnae TaxID=5949 RepID=A0A078AFY1_STYLE|nr:UNKNOWN [Stylonychia lemnae]|eukprot:CDW79793.1 UNKNOWN [Stylonychia lemnae]